MILGIPVPSLDNQVNLILKVANPRRIALPLAASIELRFSEKWNSRFPDGPALMRHGIDSYPPPEDTRDRLGAYNAKSECQFERVLLQFGRTE